MRTGTRAGCLVRSAGVNGGGPTAGTCFFMAASDLMMEDHSAFKKSVVEPATDWTSENSRGGDDGTTESAPLSPPPATLAVRAGNPVPAAEPEEEAPEAGDAGPMSGCHQSSTSASSYSTYLCKMGRRRGL